MPMLRSGAPVIGQHQKVISMGAVQIHGRLRVQVAVTAGGVQVGIALEPADVGVK